MYTQIIAELADVKPTSSEGEFRVCCPECHDSKYHMYVSASSGKFICHRCSTRGNIVTFVSLFAHIDSYQDAKAYLKERSIDLKEQRIRSREKNREALIADLFGFSDEEAKQVTVPIKMPSWVQKIKPTDKHILKYLKRRGFDVPSVITDYKLRTNDDEDMIVVPFYEGGKLVYYIARSLEGDIKRNPPTDQTKGVGKASYLFNHDNAHDHDQIVIVEGWADAITIGFNAVSIQGKVLSRVQSRKLVRMARSAKKRKGFSPTFIIFFDQNDDTARQQIQAADMLFRESGGEFIVYIVTAHGTVTGDPNDLGHDKCWQLIEKHVLNANPLNVDYIAYKMRILQA